MADGNVIDSIRRQRNVNTRFTKITVGEVVDTNDPQQMGRLRVLCPTLGDKDSQPIKHLPWASYVSPLGGISTSAHRGRDEFISAGPVAYGMWNIPKVGSTVLIACIDGDPRFRVWLGCLHAQFLPHTLPHGRYDYDTTNEAPAGPLTSSEKPIQPLHSEMTLAFTKSLDTTSTGATAEARKSYEFRSRGADYMAASVDEEIIGSEDSTISSVADNRNVTVTESDGTSHTVTQGYAESRVDPPLQFDNTGNGNYDSQVYSWTTPGFHSVSMDDRSENCRIRIRTTHGHQIIMDDTNERMYISTPQGDTWIELDEKGNIDIYGKRNVSIHAEQDINMTTDKTFRVKAKEGIHMVSETGDVRVQAKTGSLNMKGAAINSESGGDYNIKATGDTNIEGQTVNVKAHLSVKIEASSDFNVLGSTGFLTTTGGVLNMKASGDIGIDGANVFMNSGVSSPASPAASAGTTKEAYYTSRVPEHEPWARVMTKPTKTDQDSGNTHVDSAEYAYDDPNVGRHERGEDLKRNKKWHR